MERQVSPVSLLQLERCMVRRLEVIPRGDYENEPDPDAPEDLHVRFRDHGIVPGSGRLRVELDLTVRNPTGGVKGLSKLRSILVGEFQLPVDIPDEVRAETAPKVCLANLFGFRRATLAQATALVDGGPYYLPLIDMDRLMDMAERDRV